MILTLGRCSVSERSAPAGGGGTSLGQGISRQDFFIDFRPAGSPPQVLPEGRVEAQAQETASGSGPGRALAGSHGDENHEQAAEIVGTGPRRPGSANALEHHFGGQKMMIMFRQLTNPIRRSKSIAGDQVVVQPDEFVFHRSAPVAYQLVGQCSSAGGWSSAGGDRPREPPANGLPDDRRSRRALGSLADRRPGRQSVSVNIARPSARHWPSWCHPQPVRPRHGPRQRSRPARQQPADSGRGRRSASRRRRPGGQHEHEKRDDDCPA